MISLRFLCCLAAIAVVTIGCMPTPQPASAPETETKSDDTWPTLSWRTSSPHEQGVDAGRLDKMMATIEEQSLRLNGVLVIRHGAIVFEYYPGPSGQTSRRELYSVTKSFTSTLVGIALDKGLLSSIDQPVLDFFAGRSFQNVDKRKQAMTIENLLTMTSGLEWEEGDAAYTQMFRSADWTSFVLDMPMDFQPGAQFEYNSGASHILSAIVREATGLNTAEFAQANLFEPLGIAGIRWETDASGLSIGGWGLKLAPREMAKLGYLFLHGGKWDGQQIVSADWVEAATRKHVSTDGNLGYGYQWWIDAGDGAYLALGRFGQTIYVRPDLDLVVVITAHEDDHERVLELISTYILPACSE